MRIHHLNCISTCPLGGRLMDGYSDSVFSRGHLSCHCLLLEARDQLILIDTGLGLRDVRAPRSRLSWFFLSLVSPDFREEMTAVRQVERLGFDAADVRHIVLTHLDFDHAGGLDDFPQAQVHMMQRERDYALQQKTWLDRQRFRPQQWSSRDRWRVYPGGEGESWFGFDCLRPLEGVTEDLLMLPLPGHTHGHCGLAIRGGAESSSNWLLLAGDAYFYRDEMNSDPYCTPGLRFYQTMMEKNRRARLDNQQRLRALRQEHSGELRLFCSHDLREFEALAGRSAAEPVPLAQSPAAVMPGTYGNAGAERPSL